MTPRLKYRLHRNDSGVWGADPTEECEYEVLRSTEVNLDGTWRIKDPAFRCLTAQERSVGPLMAGDLLVTKSSGSESHVGKAALVDDEVAQRGSYFSNFMQRLRPNADLDPRFLFYLWNSEHGRRHMEVESSGSMAIRNLTGTILGLLPLTIDNTAIQSLIADFLDRETHRIDALVDAKRRMIDLLGEKRESSITRQVWSGGLPTTRLSFHADLLAGYAFPSNEFSTSPDGTALLRGANIGVGQTRWDDTVYWPEEKVAGLERYRLNFGDIVLGLDRPWIAGGIRVAMIGEEDLPALLLQRVLRIRAKQSMNQRFVFYLLQSRPFLAHFEPDMTGISVPHVSPDQVGNFSFPLHEVGKQAAIVRELDRVTSAIDSITETLARQLDLLAEYRRALITQAVTGQLDEATLKGDKPVDEAVGVIPE